MLKTLDNDGTYTNIIWYDALTGDLETVQIGELMARSKPMAMLALNISAMVATTKDLSCADFNVVVQHAPGVGAGFCLAPVNDLPPEEEAAVNEALREFFDDFALLADETPGLSHIDKEYCSASFSSVRAAARALHSYYKETEGLYTIDDMTGEGLTDEDLEKVQAIGAESLTDAWVFAVMPERHFNSVKEMNNYAYRVGLATVPCAFSDIMEAVRACEKEDEQAPLPARQMASYNPNGLRLH
jgi:hypothetical protein